MALHTVCRLCLIMDAPMHSIAGGPLQQVFEKLTCVSLNTRHRPVVACYICYSQLRKCHKLMVRSATAEMVLTHLLQSGDIVKGKFISTNYLQMHQLPEPLQLTPVELVSFEATEHNFINSETRMDQLPTNSNEMEMDGLRIDGFKIEKCVDEENSEGVVRENIFNEIQQWPDGDNDETVPEDVKHLTSELLDEEEDTKPEWFVRDEDGGSNESEGTAPTEERTETHAENIQDESKLIQGGEDFQENPRTRVAVEETISGNIPTDVLLNTKKDTNNTQVTITSMYSDSVNKSRGSVNSTNTYGDNTSTTHLDRMFVCNDCGDIFDDKYLLIEHIERHTDKKRSLKCSPRDATVRTQNFSKTGENKHPETRVGESLFECDICKVTLSNKCNLKRHLRVHTEDKPYECEICKVRFRWKCRLKLHSKIHHGEKLYQCEICKVRFREKGALKRHLIVHSNEKPYECEICKVRFKEKRTLKIHLIRVYTNEKPYQCDLCKVRFREKGALKRHLIVHSNEKPYECEICKVRFKEKRTLKIHLIRVHTNEKPYQCDICKVRFKEKDALKRHLIVHSNEKPYECEICKVRFKGNGTLKRHLIVHTNEKPYECEICKVRFNQKGNLKKHLRVHTKEKPYECEICKVRFTEKSTLKTHLRVHSNEKPYECEICKVRFKGKGTLNRHLRVHTNEKPYECEICKVRFNQKGNLKTHLRVHTKEKPYECEICKVRFTEKSTLKKHLKSSH